jgi:hypothetical protein
VQQCGGYLKGVAKPSGQRRTTQPFNRFHGGTITRPDKGRRISFFHSLLRCIRAALIEKKASSDVLLHFANGAPLAGDE